MLSDAISAKRLSEEHAHAHHSLALSLHCLFAESPKQTTGEQHGIFGRAPVSRSRLDEDIVLAEITANLLIQLSIAFYPTETFSQMQQSLVIAKCYSWHCPLMP